MLVLSSRHPAASSCSRTSGDQMASTCGSLGSPVIILTDHSTNLCSAPCRVDLAEAGDYRLCFENSFSKLSVKMVFFKVVVGGQSSTGGDEWADVALMEDLLEYRLDDIRVRGKSSNLSLHPTSLRHLLSSSSRPSWTPCTSSWRGPVRFRPC